MINLNIVVEVERKNLPPLIFTYYVFKEKIIVTGDGVEFSIKFRRLAMPHHIKDLPLTQKIEEMERFFLPVARRRLRSWQDKNQPHKGKTLSNAEKTEYWRQRFITHGKYM